MNTMDFYIWYGDQVGYEEMATHFGFKNHDEMCDWHARRLGYASYKDMPEEDIPDDYGDTDVAG